VATNANRLLYGELPYRDYFLRIPPLTDWAVGLWLGLFGNQLSVLRLYFLFSVLVSTVALTKLSYRHLSAGLCWLPPLWFIMIGPQAWPMASFHWDATALALLAILLLDNRKSPRRLVFVGMLVACCGMCLHTKGAALWVACTVTFLWEPSGERGRGARAILLGVSIPSLVFLVGLSLYGGLGAFFQQTLAFNAGRYLDVQGHSLDLSPLTQDFHTLIDGLRKSSGKIGLPTVAWAFQAASYILMIDVMGLALYYPLVILGGVGLLWKGRLALSMRALVITLLLASLIDLGRPNRYHLNFHLPLLTLLVALLLDLVPARALRNGAGLFLGICALLVGWSNVQSWSAYRFPVSLPRGTVLTQDPGEAALLGELYSITGRDAGEQAMFAFPDASLTAWLLGLRNPTGLTAAVPLFYSDEMLKGAKVSIEAAQAKWLLYRPIGAASMRDYGLDVEEFSRQQDQVRDLLTSGFQVERAWGSTVLYRRSEATAKSPDARESAPLPESDVRP
jgi:hypothetical protein